MADGRKVVACCPRLPRNSACDGFSLAGRPLAAVATTATLVTRARWPAFWHGLARFSAISASLSFMGCHAPLSGLRVAHRSVIIGRFRRK